MTGTLKRRHILQGGAVLLAAAMGSATAVHVRKPKTAIGEKTMDTSYTPAGKGIVTGKGVGDFDFLSGNWHIQHKRRTDITKDDWQRFESTATVHRVLNGMGSIEELRNADGSDMGMAVRTWLPKLEKWTDHWTSAVNGVIGAPQMGEFIDGEGVFITEEEVDGINWQYRGVWDRITSESCRWHRSVSNDDGENWKWNWWMEWTRRR